MSCQLTTIGLLPKEVDRVFNEWAKSTGTFAGGLKGLRGFTSNLEFSMTDWRTYFAPETAGSRLFHCGGAVHSHLTTHRCPCLTSHYWRSDGLDQLEQEPAEGA